MAWDCCCLIVLFAMPTAVALLQWTGIFGCGWPRSLRVSLKIIPSWQVRNNAPSLTSAANASTNQKNEHSVWKAPINLMGFPSIGKDLMKKWPHAMLQAFGLLKYDASKRCSSSSLMLKIVPMHHGALPSNQAPGMPLFACSQLYLTPLTLSY